MCVHCVSEHVVVVVVAVVARDRFRTMVNVMGDALATGIMAHICRKDFVKEGEQVREAQPDTAAPLPRSLFLFPHHTPE